MAAPRRKTEEDSSSSEDETLKRCREAVWETQANNRKDGDSGVKSKRVVVADHEHDGNALQVTRGFQTHVAQKLQHFLDSCISEMQPDTSHGLESSNCAQDNQEGFRLFSTSVPVQQADHPPAPAKRRPAPSSSDSDSEMELRVKEAAVSIKDLLPSPTLPSSSTPSSAETPASDRKQKKNKVEEESGIIRKKKKKKQNDEESEQVDSAGPAPDQSNGQRRTSEHVKVKRKKKQKGNSGRKSELSFHH